MDDIVLAYRKQDEKIVNSIVKDLKKHYNITGGHGLQWFLGIEILRDRPKKLIWLSQSSYIDKVATLADENSRNQKIDRRIPMARIELLPYSGRATYSEIN